MPVRFRVHFLATKGISYVSKFTTMTSMAYPSPGTPVSWEIQPKRRAMSHMRAFAGSPVGCQEDERALVNPSA